MLVIEINPGSTDMTMSDRHSPLKSILITTLRVHSPVFVLLVLHLVLVKFSWPVQLVVAVLGVIMVV